MSLDTEEMRIRLSEFLEHSQSNPLSSDDSPLRQMCLEVETEIDSYLTPELVHLADDIYRYLGQDGLEKTHFSSSNIYRCCAQCRGAILVKLAFG